MQVIATSLITMTFHPIVPIEYPYLYEFNFGGDAYPIITFDHWKTKLPTGEVYIAFKVPLDTTAYPDYKFIPE